MAHAPPEFLSTHPGAADREAQMVQAALVVMPLAGNGGGLTSKKKGPPVRGAQPDGLADIHLPKDLSDPASSVFAQ